MTATCDRCAKAFDENELRRAIFIDADLARTAATYKTWSVCTECMAILKETLRCAIESQLIRFTPMGRDR